MLTIHLMLLTTVLLATDGEPAVTDVYEQHEIRYTGGEYTDHAFRYRLMKPARLETGKKYPLVLFLHGAGERGDDNRISLKYLPTWLADRTMRKRLPCYVLVPQCPKDRMWIDFHWARKHHSMSPDPTHEMRAVMRMLDTVMGEERAGIDPDRVILTGLSMGGYGSWDLASRHPDWFSCVVPICGGGDEKQAAQLVDVPIWAWHGDQDVAVPVERSRKMIAAIRAAGGEPRYTELAHVNHDSWSPAYHSNDLLAWMFRQTRAAR